jgi:hypothetical protein
VAPSRGGRPLAAASLLALALAFVGHGGAAAATASGCRSTGHVVCVTRADGGHQVRVRLGQEVEVRLGGSELRWSGLRQVGPRLLRAAADVGHRGGTVTANYAAVAKGRTELRATAAPRCESGQACPQFIVLWQVRVVVS